MDVDRFNFWQTLPTVLEAISLSDYVSFDLEMSGIPNSVGTSQPTESTFYHLAAEAARTFQILQVGLTCLSYDCKHKVYRARTFTFQLTPEFLPPNTALAKLIDRKLVLSYRSFLFLKENNFSFEKTFSQGVPYLSRSEGALANSLYPAAEVMGQRIQKAAGLRRFRYIIEALVGGSFASALNLELLLNNTHLAPTSQPSTTSQLRQNLHLYEARLRTRPPILIGHNPFLDLCILHETFLQPLPADALAFRRATRHFFPRLIDTKHLACQLGWEPSRNLAQLYSDLVGRNHNHHHQHPQNHHHRHPQHHHQPPPPQPPIIPEPGFDARERGAAHSAGFDSWMAAAVFVALSGQVLLSSSRGAGSLSAPPPPPPPPSSRTRKGDEMFRELCPFAGAAAAAVGAAVCGLKGGGELGVGEEGGELPLSLPPRWDGEVWGRYGNKLRMGAAGVMDLARE
ncbi:ribonuclease H-like domain-containing protein [Chaetomium sp. MPI-CAGE-AT-0009]|nr:ribonuclease H-like domain-containing protein [Chaetomium sp. MPI-CAGE-AT-0009]